jgi:hypothetical protein
MSHVFVSSLLAGSLFAVSCCLLLVLLPGAGAYSIMNHEEIDHNAHSVDEMSYRYVRNSSKQVCQ